MQSDFVLGRGLTVSLVSTFLFHGRMAAESLPECEFKGSSCLQNSTCLRLNHIERLDVHRFWNVKGKD